MRLPRGERYRRAFKGLQALLAYAIPIRSIARECYSASHNHDIVYRPLQNSIVASARLVHAEGARFSWLALDRGKHCPLCKRYFKTLDGLLGEFKAVGVSVGAVSADPKEKAEADVAEHAWRFPVGYGLTIDQMRMLGLYISNPRSPQETDRPFAEPGLFVINPAGDTHIIDISNAPFSRPDLQMVLNGIKTIIEKSYPVRGTHA